MDDLISRSSLLKKFNDTGIQITFDLPVEEVLGEDVDIDDFTMLVQDVIQAYKNMVIGTIKDMPTAYDVEKVIHKIDETLFEFGAGNDCTRCAFREVCDDGNDGCIDTMAEVFRNTVRMGGVL